MGRKSSWRNKPLKSVSFPINQEDFLRELTRSLDSASPGNFQRFVLDIDGAAISISVKLSLVEVESNEPALPALIGDTPSEIAAELPEGVDIDLSNGFIPSILRLSVTQKSAG